MAFSLFVITSARIVDPMINGVIIKKNDVGEDMLIH